LEVKTGRDPYFPGENLQAHLNIETNKKFNFKELRLELICQSTFRWDVVRRYSLYSSGSEDEDPDEMVHEFFTFKLMELKEVLAGEEEVTKAGIKVSGEIGIPEDAPPTFAGGWIKTIWTLKAVIDRRLRKDIVAKKQIVVLSKVSPEEVGGGINIPIDRKDFSGYIKLPRTVFMIGETIEGEIELVPTKNLEIDELKMEMFNRGTIIPERVLSQPIVSSTDFNGTDVYSSPVKVLKSNFKLVEGLKFGLPFSYRAPSVRRPSCKTEYYQSKWFLRLEFSKRDAPSTIITVPISIVDKID